MRVILDYEIRGSWWAPLVSFSPLQRLAGSYFARKVRRKYGRWQRSVSDKQTLTANHLKQPPT